jgi:hypothetical protein
VPARRREDCKAMQQLTWQHTRRHLKPETDAKSEKRKAKRGTRLGLVVSGLRARREFTVLQFTNTRVACLPDWDGARKVSCATNCCATKRRKTENRTGYGAEVEVEYHGGLALVQWRKSEGTSDKTDTAMECNSSSEYCPRTTPHFNPACLVSTCDGSAF